MLTYHYDEKTKEFIYAEKAFLDPLESKVQGKDIFLLPANATFIPPTEVKEGCVNVWNGDEWEEVEDNRGVAYWLPGDVYGMNARIMKELGALPDGAILEAPEKSAPTEAEIQEELTQAVQAYMDGTVQARGYDNIHTACSYSNSTDHIFAAEGQACLQWRDKVWRKCYDILAEVKAGTRGIPTLEEVIAELPVLVW